ncbi:hypothetical protein B0H13DRAFT_2529711 [Mycena leptocephala]|nr:hypothetical protein B0H13DRAFT_2529711 [Mycena leptocephala]
MTSFFCNPRNLLPLLLLLQTLSPSTAAVIYNDRKNQTIRWVDCHDKVPEPLAAALNITGTTFTGTLPSSLFCGEMDVPMDYTKPFNASHQQHHHWLRDESPQKVFWPTCLPCRHVIETSEDLLSYRVVVGGPGVDAASQAWGNALNLSPNLSTAFPGAAAFAGLEDFDFLALNTRGLQFSNPLNFSSGVFFNDIPFPFPKSQAEFDQYQAAMTNFISAAIRDSTPPGIMQHVGTIEYIQDLDSLRGALGYEKLNFEGISYGTFVGMEYAARYPDRVGRFVLDAAFPHGMPFQDMVTSQVAAANRLIQRADAFCLIDPGCPFGQGLGNAPCPGPTGTASCSELRPRHACIAPVTARHLQWAVDSSFHTIPDFPLFNLALNASLHGNASLFAYQPANDPREGLLTPLLCSDLRLDDSIKTFAGFNNLSINSQSSDPLHVVYSQIWQNLLQCSVWPFPGPRSTTLPTDLEIMWVTSDFDLALPTEMTTFAWEQAPKSTLVIRHGDDHTSFWVPPPGDTAGDVARSFLRTGVMPSPRSDAAVTIIGPGEKRGPLPGAYNVPIGAVAGDMSSVENIV